MGSLILCYHSIDYSQRITPDDLEKQLIILKENGFRPIRLSEIYSYIKEGKNPPSKTVHLTFDDGYADNYIYAYPILKKHGFFATIFVIANKVTEGIKRATYEELIDINSTDKVKELLGKSEYVSWEELNEMLNSGIFEVGSHSLNHKACFCCPKVHKFNEDNSYRWFLELTNDRRLGIPIYEKKWDCTTLCMKDDMRIRDYLSDFVKSNGGVLFFKKPNAQRILAREYKRFIKKNGMNIQYETKEEKLIRTEEEISESKRIIEEKLNREVDFFCYPWGHYDVDVVYELIRNSYKAALTLNVGLVFKDTYPYLLPRVEVRNTKWLKKRLKIYKNPIKAKIYAKIHKAI